jgi:hypothetical protein
MLSAELGPDGGFLMEPEEETGAGGRIVMLYADAATQANLTAWAEAMGFDLEEGAGTGLAFHITLLATANDVAIPLTSHLVEPVVVVPIGVAHLGENEDTPAFTLAENGQLEAMRAHFVDTYGAEPTFDFLPHVSLSYNWDGEPDLRDRDLPDFDMVFDRLVVEPFDSGKAAVRPAAKATIMTLHGEFLDETVSVGEAIEVARIRARNRGESLLVQGTASSLIVHPDGTVAASEGASTMSRDRKGLMDWLLGSPEDRDLQEELAEYSQDIYQLVESIQSEIADLAEAEPGDVSRYDGARARINGLFDEIVAFVRLEAQAVADHRATSADDDDKSQPSPLRQVIADLEKAA